PKRTATSTPAIISSRWLLTIRSIESHGCAPRNRGRPGASTVRANHGSTLTLSFPLTAAAAPAASVAASSMPARSGITCAWKRRSSPVSVTERGVRSNNRTPTLLEARHCPADAGRRQTQCLGRAGEIACLGDRRQHADAGQDARIEAHEETPTVTDGHHNVDSLCAKIISNDGLYERERERRNGRL